MLSSDPKVITILPTRVYTRLRLHLVAPILTLTCLLVEWGMGNGDGEWGLGGWDDGEQLDGLCLSVCLPVCLSACQDEVDCAVVGSRMMLWVFKVLSYFVIGLG